MILHDLDERDYHARPELSSTQARQILDSPARYRWGLDHPRPSTAAFDVGTAAHSKILGVGAGVVAYPDEHLTASGNVSTKAATAAWADEQRANGLTPVSPDQIAAVDAMAEAVLAHVEARALLEQPGHAEASVFATCDETGIDLRARFDYLPELDSTEPIAVDVKTTAGRADAREFGKSVANYGYHIQQGHYLEALRLDTGRDDIGFRFLVVEKSAPHFVGVIELDSYYGDIGIEDARRARRILRECTVTDTWPTGLEDITYLGAPAWLDPDN